MKIPSEFELRKRLEALQQAREGCEELKVELFKAVNRLKQDLQEGLVDEQRYNVEVAKLPKRPEQIISECNAEIAAIESDIASCREQLDSLHEDKKNERIRTAAILAMLLLFSVGLPLLTIKLTGFVVSEEVTAYSQDIGVNFTSSQAFALNIERTGGVGELRSLLLGGKLIGDGKVRVYLEKGAERYLILNETAIKQKGVTSAKALTSITGRAVAEASERAKDAVESIRLNLTDATTAATAATEANATANATAENATVEITLPVPEQEAALLNETNATINETQEALQPELPPAAEVEKAINISLAYNAGTVFDSNDDGVELDIFAIDFTVDGSNFSWAADGSRLCTRWVTQSLDNNSDSSICHGSAECCALLELAPFEESWDETFNVFVGRYGAAYNNTVSSQVIFANYSLEPGNVYSEIYYSEFGSLPATFVTVPPLEEGIINETNATNVTVTVTEFSNLCVETCSLAGVGGLNLSEYSLVIVVENATLELDNATYTLAKVTEIDIEAPIVTISEPRNITYTETVTAAETRNTTALSLRFAVSEPANRIWYSLNNGDNTTITAGAGTLTTTITAANGTNTLLVFANDASGNVGYAVAEFFINFTTAAVIDTEPPMITVISPLPNATYNTTAVALNFALSEPATVSYFLNLQNRTELTSNVTLSAEEGRNRLLLLATDAAGNVGSETVIFFVNTSNITTANITVANLTTNITPLLKAKKPHFKLGEDAELEFEYIGDETAEELEKRGKALRKASEGIRTKEWVSENETIKTYMYDSEGKLTGLGPQIEEFREGKFSIKLPKQRQFRAGLYRLVLNFTKDNSSYVQEQNFTWGVLAINTNKSIFLPNEDAFVAMAVLDDQGHMVCDANVTLTITGAAGAATTLTTAAGQIAISPECQVYGITNLPDYYTNYTVNGTGTYVMNLTAVTANGIRTILDNFTVQSQVDFDVARAGPTRIWPFAPYNMSFAIMANQNYNGIITEFVPASFNITPQQGLTVTTIAAANAKALSWNVQLKKDDTIILNYEFDAPDISPEFYLLGELGIGAWKEARQWQIASDAGKIQDDFFTIVPTSIDVDQWVNLSGQYDNTGNANCDQVLKITEGGTTITSSSSTAVQLVEVKFVAPCDSVNLATGQLTCTGWATGNDNIPINWTVKGVTGGGGSKTYTTASVSGCAVTLDATDTLSVNAGDTTAPNVTIIVPPRLDINNTNVSGSFLVNASVNDTTGVARVNLTVYNNTANATNRIPMSLGADTTTAGWWNITFDSTTLPDGYYNLSVNATDSAATPNTAISANVSIIIDNTKANVSVITPANGTSFSSQSFLINASVNDSLTGVFNVSFRLINESGETSWVGATLGAGTITAGWWNITFDSLTVNNGLYNITVNATDYAQNQQLLNISRISIANPIKVLAAGESGNKFLRAQGCNNMDSTTSSDFSLACAGTYPGDGCGDTADRLSCSDASAESSTLSNGEWGGVNITAYNDTISDCDSINIVNVCFSWSISTSESYDNCNVSVDRHGDFSWNTTAVTCPTTTTGIVECAAVTSLEGGGWSCSDFFGTTDPLAWANIQAHRTSAGASHSLNLNALYFNITYFQASDTTPPNVTIIVPPRLDINNTNVSGSFLVNASVNDTTGVARVNLTVYNNTGNATGLIRMSRGAGTSTSGYWNVTFDSTTLPDGRYNLSVNATDSAATQNTAISANVSITVDNTAANVSAVAPLNGTPQNGTILINASVNDTLSKVLNASFRLTTATGSTVTNWLYATVNGTQLNNRNQGYWNTTIDTRTLNDSIYYITINATDYAQNQRLVNISQIEIDNIPNATITMPAANSNFSGNMLVRASANSTNLEILNVNLTVYNYTGNATALRTMALTSGSLTSGYWDATIDTTALRDAVYDLSVNATTQGIATNITANISVTIDNTRPNVSITAPLNKTLQNGTILINASVNDSLSRVFNVTFRLETPFGGAKTGWLDATVNGTQLSNRNQGYWTATIDTRTLNDSTYNITINATDYSGNQRIVNISQIEIDNIPNATIIVPTQNANISGTFMINASANSSNLKILNVNLTIYNYTGNATALRTMNLSAGSQTSGYWNTTFDSTTLPDGFYNLSVNVTTQETRTNITTNISVTIDNTKPNATGISPLNNANISGSFVINASVNDSISKAFNVTFRLTTSTGSTVTSWLYATIGTGNFDQGYWNTTFETRTIGNGDYNITINATDYAGNQQIINISTVTVQNSVATAAGENEDVLLEAQACYSEDSKQKGELTDACDGSYPAACGEAGDLVSCNDGNVEAHSVQTLAYGGLNLSQISNSTVTNCREIVTVSVCYELWGETGLPTADCDISVDNDGDLTWTAATTECPSDTANPGIACLDVTTLDGNDWACGNFFGSTGTTAAIKSEMTQSGGISKVVFWDALYYNVTYELANNATVTEPGANANASGSFLINASINASLGKTITKVNATLSNNTGNATGLIAMTLGAGTSASGWWNVTFASATLRDATYNISVNVTDDSGFVIITPNISIIIDNTIPNGTILSPANATNIRGFFTINASVNDTLTKVQNVSFRLRRPGYEGTLAFAALVSGTTDQGVWNASFNSSTVPNGVYNITLNATDFAGNRLLVNTSNIVVNNSGFLNITFNGPKGGFNITQNRTFTVNATVACMNGFCQQVNATVYYNLTSLSPATRINATALEVPFHNVTTFVNQTCGYLDIDAVCSLNWTINATGPTGSMFYFSVNFTSNSSEVSQNGTSNFQINISEPAVTNTAPLVFNNSVALNSSVTLSEGGRTQFVVKFNVTDADSTSDLNNAAVGVNITFNGIRRANNTGNCENLGDSDSNTRLFSCIVVFNYFDNSSSIWEINLSAADSTGAVGYNDSNPGRGGGAANNLTIESLSAFSLSTGSAATTANINTQDNELSFVVNNTGNFDFTILNITPFDLNASLTDLFRLNGNFSINSTASTGSGLGQNILNGTPTNFTDISNSATNISATLPHKITSGESDNLGNRTLYIYIDIPINKGLSTGVTYNVSSAWELFAS